MTREALGEAEQGTLYRVDLVGLQVKDEAGEVLGRVEGFFDTGDTGVMVVKGARERWQNRKKEPGPPSSSEPSRSIS